MRPTSLGWLLILAGCATTNPAVDPHFKLRPETRPECTARCSEMGMRLGAVVLIQNSAGCVCEPEEGVTSAARAAAVATGAVTIAAAEEEALAEQRLRENEERRRREDEEERERRRREDEERQRREDEARRQREAE